MKILMALETADREWRVEVAQEGKRVFYRLIHGDNVINGLVIATLERLLREAGVDMSELVEAPNRAAMA